MRCFILAGGFATRLWPLTEKRAKPLLPLAGKPIITHLIEKIPTDLPITVSTNAVFQDGFEQWQKTLNRTIDLIIEDSIRDDQKLGALGAVAQWVREGNIRDDLLLLTGDNYCGFPLERFIQSFHDTTLLAVHDIDSLEKARSYGTVIIKEKNVSGFEEKPANPKTTLVNTGVSLLPCGVLSILIDYAKSHPDNVGSVFEEFLHRELPIECFRFSEPWFDIGSFDSYLEATNVLVGNSVINDGSVSADSKTIGAVVIGKNSQVKKSILHNVVLFENCSVTDCVLKDCIVDCNCTLSHIDLTHKMIREGTILERK